jgi:MYXO-CTERM domain-containing protein
MRPSILLFASPLLSCLLLGCGSQDDPSRELARHSESIAGGQVDTYHTSVLGMFTMSGYGGGMCSGTLIAPNLVLTAQHCVAPILGNSEYVICGKSAFGNPYAGSNVYVTNDQKMSQDSTNWWQGSSVHVPTDGNDTCGFDVALVILSKNVPQSVTTPYVPRIDVEPEPGELYQAVGYGTTGYGYGGARMHRSNLKVVCKPGGSCGYGINSREWLGDTGICQGDSGGPALDMNDKVIGVVSRGSEPCDTPIYGSVTAWKPWLTEIALKAAEQGGYDPPFWVLTGKSDPETEPPPIEPGTGGSGGQSGEGGSGGGSEPDPQGQPCSKDLTCPNGFACWNDQEPPAPYCTATCVSNAECGGGLVCNGDQVCVAATGDSGSSGGCSVAGGPAKPVPWGALLLAASLLGLRRRRPAIH